MERLTDIDVFNRSSDSEWVAPTFIQAKKTGDVRLLTDFRRLNAQIRRKPFPLPKISDLLIKLSGFKYATAIDLSMGYYHIPLDLKAQKLCTTILPWGKYQYKRLPMGVLIPQVRLAHKYPNSHWEMIHPPGGDNVVCMYVNTSGKAGAQILQLPLGDDSTPWGR
jgi:hypothetical protein